MAVSIDRKGNFPILLKKNVGGADQGKKEKSKHMTEVSYRIFLNAEALFSGGFSCRDGLIKWL